MAISGEFYLDQIEDAINELRLALQQPHLIKMRIISTDTQGVSCIEVLQEDLRFGSPFFT
jgi:hypothetical protein